jgi:hypothetical protein
MGMPDNAATSQARILSLTRAQRRARECHQYLPWTFSYSPVPTRALPSKSAAKVTWNKLDLENRTPFLHVTCSND